MQRLLGGCHCGNIRVQLELTREAATYQPRACDCDFCRRHRAAYVSDPGGSLLIEIRAERDCARYAQGSGQAQMLLCRRCGVLVAPLYVEAAQDGRLYAAVNVNSIAGAVFGAPQPVSPQALAAGDKVRRWKDLWFADVTLRHAP